jgi:hypothetical protein
MGHGHTKKLDEWTRLGRLLLLSSFILLGLFTLVIGVFFVSACAIAQIAGLIGGIFDGFLKSLLPGLFSGLFWMALVYLAQIYDTWGQLSWLLLALLGLLLSGGVH